MAVGKEIRGKIKSVENTKKITKAMEMVAASKMRKAQERMRAARPYSEKIRSLAANLSQATPEYKHAFMVSNDAAKPAGFVVVTTDKGLCGGLNTNVLRAVTVKLRELEGQGVKTEHGWDYLYEPDAPTVIDELLMRYTEALVYQAVAENMASEQSARMVAMKSATDNAGNVIAELKLIYNKTRQAAITKELSEIVAGAAAV